MDGTRIAQLVSRGYAISAASTGTPYQLFRPADGSAPLSAGPVTSLPVTISTDSYRFRQPVAYAKPARQILVDTSQTRAGDYLVGPQTLFVADQSPLLPVVAIVCNTVLTIKRPTASTSVGAVAAYGGDEAGREQTLATSFPASMLQGTKGERGDVNLPGDTRLPWWMVLLPVIPGVNIETDDVLYDAAGTRYLVSSAEMSQLGWRLTAMQSSA